jgi:hypothetical protein
MCRYKIMERKSLKDRLSKLILSRIRGLRDLKDGFWI